MDQSGFFYDEGSAVPVSDRIHVLVRDARRHLPATAIILAGGMTRERAEGLIEDGTIDLAAFGQPFISNPDLVARLQNGWALTVPDRDTYYGGGAEGFIDYPAFEAA